jgi:carbamoyltransferase
MIQLGISAFYHDSAACLVVDGKVIAAAEEERFTGIKHDSSFPFNAINWCLRYTRTTLKAVDQVCWYENPELKKDRVLTTFNKHFFKTLLLRYRYLRDYKKYNPETILRRGGFKGEIVYTDHHTSHAAFSLHTSPYENPAILTVDGVGEWDTTAVYRSRNGKVQKMQSIKYPNSLGLVYSTITAYLGFKPNEGEYKIMGLAPYGNPDVYLGKLMSLVENTSNQFKLNTKPFSWEYSDKVMFNKNLFKALGILPRFPEEPVTQEHKDLAAALQKWYEYQFTKLLITAKNMSKSPNLCLGGGCAYNGVANALAYKYFDSVHIPFSPSDAGSAIGACLHHYKGERKDNSNPYLGPDYKDIDIHKAINDFQEKWPDFITSFRLSDDLIVKKTAELLSKQKIVAWFQGRMEFGARALGNRSILAAPQDPKMREKLNYVIKKREGFRPFAPSVKADEASKYFDLKEEVPYMNIVVQAKTKRIPSAVHIDNSARVHTVTPEQNERYYLLLDEIKRLTGSPILLNTSFNLKDQTITISPEQAISRFMKSNIDFLVINNHLIQKL